MEIPQNLLSFGSPLSPSHPPPLKKPPSGNIGLPHLSDQYSKNYCSHSALVPNTVCYTVQYYVCIQWNLSNQGTPK